MFTNGETSGGNRAIYEGDLFRRRQAVDVEISDLEARIERLRSVREAIEFAGSIFNDERLAEIVRGEATSLAMAPVEAEPDLAGSADGEERTMSQRAMIMEVLTGVTEPQSPIGIGVMIKERFGVDAHRTSISSQLQKLLGMNKVVRAEEGWTTRDPGAPAKAPHGDGAE